MEIHPVSKDNHLEDRKENDQRKDKCNKENDKTKEQYQNILNLDLSESSSDSETF